MLGKYSYHWAPPQPYLYLQTPCDSIQAWACPVGWSHVEISPVVAGTSGTHSSHREVYWGHWSQGIRTHFLQATSSHGYPGFLTSRKGQQWRHQRGTLEEQWSSALQCRVFFPALVDSLREAEDMLSVNNTGCSRRELTWQAITI